MTSVGTHLECPLGMFLATITIELPRERRKEALETIRTLTGHVPIRRGCISSRFYQDIDNENALILVEEWETEEGLIKYVRSDDYRKLLSLIDLSINKPVIRFIASTDAEGMEYISWLRGATEL